MIDEIRSVSPPLDYQGPLVLMEDDEEENPTEGIRAQLTAPCVTRGAAKADIASPERPGEDAVRPPDSLFVGEPPLDSAAQPHSGELMLYTGGPRLARRLWLIEIERAHVATL